MAQRRKRCDRRFKASAAKVVPSREMTAKDLSEELGVKDSTLRRWACECEEMGDDAFPGNGSPKINRDHEIVKLDRENETLKNFRAFLSQGHARGSSSSKSIGARSAPSRRQRADGSLEIRFLRASRPEEAQRPDRARSACSASCGSSGLPKRARPENTVFRRRSSRETLG